MTHCSLITDHCVKSLLPLNLIRQISLAGRSVYINIKTRIQNLDFGQTAGELMLNVRKQRTGRPWSLRQSS